MTKQLPKRPPNQYEADGPLTARTCLSLKGKVADRHVSLAYMAGDNFRPAACRLGCHRQLWPRTCLLPDSVVRPLFGVSRQ